MVVWFSAQDQSCGALHPGARRGHVDLRSSSPRPGKIQSTTTKHTLTFISRMFSICIFNFNLYKSLKDESDRLKRYWKGRRSEEEKRRILYHDPNCLVSLCCLSAKMRRNPESCLLSVSGWFHEWWENLGCGALVPHQRWQHYRWVCSGWWKLLFFVI